MVDSTGAPVPIPITDSAEAEMETIMTEYESGLLRYAARLLHDPASAQDVVQETFIKLFQGWHTGERPDLAGKAIVPDVLLQAHSAALQWTFYTATSGVAVFPADYRGDAFVALHGSWNRTVRTGQRSLLRRHRPDQRRALYHEHHHRDFDG